MKMRLLLMLLLAVVPMALCVILVVKWEVVSSYLLGWGGQWRTEETVYYGGLAVDRNDLTPTWSLQQETPSPPYYRVERIRNVRDGRIIASDITKFSADGEMILWWRERSSLQYPASSLRVGLGADLCCQIPLNTGSRPNYEVDFYSESLGSAKKSFETAGKWPPISHFATLAFAEDGELKRSWFANESSEKVQPNARRYSLQECLELLKTAEVPEFEKLRELDWLRKVKESAE